MVRVLPFLAVAFAFVVLTLLRSGRRSLLPGLMMIAAVGLVLGLALSFLVGTVPYADGSKLFAVLLVSQVPGLLVFGAWHLWRRSRPAAVAVLVASVASAAYFTQLLLLSVCGITGDCL